MVITARLALK